MIAIISANDHEHHSLTRPVKSISSLVYRRKRHRAGLFCTGFFFLVVYLSSKMSNRPYIFTDMKPLKT